MSMRNEVSDKMEYIQKVFLGVQDYMQRNPGLEPDDLVAFLNSEPPEFRSVAYESASMELALYDLSIGLQSKRWETFYHRYRESHPFHIEIGLGWAFAKKEVSPASDLTPWGLLIRVMFFDGMGYCFGLFKARKTIKNHFIPEGIEAQDIHGFDQGLGRRLWYNIWGDVSKVAPLIQAFPSVRQPDLWRGVGVACGYVGGSAEADLGFLLEASGPYKSQLRTGIMLAAISRRASNSITADVEIACRMLCGMTIAEIPAFETRDESKHYPKSIQAYNSWLAQLEATLV